MLTKHFFKEDLLIMKLSKILIFTQPSRYCCLLNLRQGTIIIALLELLLSSFLLFLLLLCAIHAQYTNFMTSFDLQHIKDTNWTEKCCNNAVDFFSNNEKKIINGQHLAFATMITIYLSIVITTIHLISCALLLYGAIKSSSNFLLPWTSTVFLGLILASVFLLTIPFIPMHHCKAESSAFLFIYLCFELYNWTIVFGFYREVRTSEFEAFGNVKHYLKMPQKGDADFQKAALQNC